jgi:hypothetical protein
MKRREMRKNKKLMVKGDDNVTIGFEIYCKQVVNACIEGYLSDLLVYY